MRLIRSNGLQSKYKKILETLHPLDFGPVPELLKGIYFVIYYFLTLILNSDSLTSMLSIDPEKRLTIKQFLESPYFLKDNLVCFVYFLSFSFIFSFKQCISSMILLERMMEPKQPFFKDFKNLFLNSQQWH